MTAPTSFGDVAKRLVVSPQFWLLVIGILVSAVLFVRGDADAKQLAEGLGALGAFVVSVTVIQSVNAANNAAKIQMNKDTADAQFESARVSAAFAAPSMGTPPLSEGQVLIPAGTMVKIKGMPFQLVSPTVATGSGYNLRVVLGDSAEDSSSH